MKRGHLAQPLEKASIITCTVWLLNLILSVNQGPVVQSIVNFTSLLVVKILIVLVSTISNSQVFLLKKNASSFCICKSYSHFFSKSISVHAISLLLTSLVLNNWAQNFLFIYFFFVFFLFFVREIKAWHFIWIVYIADNSHEMPSLIFSSK